MLILERARGECDYYFYVIHCIIIYNIFDNYYNYNHRCETIYEKKKKKIMVEINERLY